MGDNSANSYDLLRAQQILTVLRKSPCSTSRKRDSEPDSTSPYLTFSRQGLTRQAGQDRTADATEPEQLPTEKQRNDTPTSFDNWESCIAWCMTMSRAEAVFVVDSQGFVIACRGRIPSQGFEGAGAELICSIEQLERIAPDSGRLSCVDLEFDKKRLIGFVATTDETEPYIVGLVSPETLTSQTKQRILQQITSNLTNMN